MKPAERPKMLEGFTFKVKSGCGNVYVTVNVNGKPQEVFLHTAKSGGCIAALTEAIGRLISISLRAGVDLNEVIKQLENIRCPKPVIGGAVSCPDAVAKSLKEVKKILAKEEKTTLQEDQEEARPEPESGEFKEFLECPRCGAEMVFEEGCVKCYSCGYSECG